MKRTLFAFLIFLLTACSAAAPPTSPTLTPFSPSLATVTLPQASAASPAPSLAASAAPTVTPSILPTATPPIPTSTTTAQPQAALPDPAPYTWAVIATGLDTPVGLANAGDGSGRLFVVEKPGRIRIIRNGSLLDTPFLNIRDRVGSSGSEQGLLGLAFHPQYAQNGYFYVNYTDKNGNTVIARFSVSAQDPNRADPTSEQRLISVSQPFRNHNGGEVTFGPDGYLYLGLGDGGSAGDPYGNGQSLDTFLGKILRIDVDQGQPYAIPQDNPFVGQNAKPEIWAYGLRNPWRFSFDRDTDDLFIGDVGQDSWEEIDYLPAGSPGGMNFGWDYFEGKHKYSDQAPPASFTWVAPVAEYSHDLGCSITGGFIYRGSQLPAWRGVYLYGDYCSGNVWGLVHNAQGGWDDAMLFNDAANITSFGEDESGEIYLADYGGNVLQLVER
jgi:glucose/arabinose dehydrogenase